MGTPIDWGKFGSDFLETGLEFLDNTLNHRKTMDSDVSSGNEPSKNTQGFSVMGGNMPIFLLVGVGIVGLFLILRK